ncbi:bola-like protein-domain-containing protein [Crepidotus variabilis]|uniref:Bola-like protein-domain-containing protein n=1 Tax=Crepidotus variabilis TaxID=179855 RepID=A0A9P6JKN0_9AGAR|nr:bola-like protein-domain-containing protein [Crepidotus variabilis]
MFIYRVAKSSRILSAIPKRYHSMNSGSAQSTPGPVEQSILAKLTQLLQPTSIRVTNDSWQHRHHAAMREQGGSNSETHFSVNVISNAFDSKTTMQRHRMIYGALSDEFANGLHALSLKTKTEAEAQKESQGATSS